MTHADERKSNWITYILVMKFIKVMKRERKAPKTARVANGSVGMGTATASSLHLNFLNADPSTAKNRCCETQAGVDSYDPSVANLNAQSITRFVFLETNSESKPIFVFSARQLAFGQVIDKYSVSAGADFYNGQ